MIFLTHNGSGVVINSHTASVVNWQMIGGANHVNQHTWYFRDGDGGAASPISDIGTPTDTLFGTQGVEIVYANSDLTVTINYFLQANSDGTAASLAEQVAFETNFGINLRLFQYNDYDINGTPADDTATRLNSSTIVQFDGDFAATTGGTPFPDFSEIGPFSALLQNIEGTAGYNLNTLAGNGIGETVNGNMTFAYQWNRNLGDGDSFVLSTNKVAAVPEPTTFAVLGVGALALLRRRRRIAA